MANATTNTSMIAIVEKINDDYEYIQYNEKLRLIHSIKDDMYQMQSIIASCNSKKRVNDWFHIQSAQEILNEMKSTGIPADQKSYEDRPNLSNDLKGYYVHRLLVNYIAMWASPKYAIYIAQLLDSLFEKQRDELQNKIDNQQKVIKEQKPRMVPNGKQTNYKYMIWKEDINKPEYIRLHLVRRNTKSFYEYTKIKNSDACWYFKYDLPIAMTPNEDIKKLIKKNFAGEEAIAKGCNIDIKIDKLEQLKELITTYFNTYQA
ncbi:hypothetical protein M9Y10_030431 [Tritrichomonas musculus]|uniref:KilA-N domain-containing protein n=1 Tax=Tritrichomonas musculus TaxID=1915356 RepID=A0ABR2H3C8_9EUKA